MPLKDLKPRRGRAPVEGTKHRSLVKMEFVIDLGLLRGGEVASLLSAQPSRKHLGTTLSIQSLQLLLGLFTPHLGWTAGAPGHNPDLNVQQSGLPTCPAGLLP